MAMTEEFQEAEVMFWENYVDHSCLDLRQQQEQAKNSPEIEKKKKKMGNLVPVRIPNHTFDVSRVINDVYDDDNGEIVPPHLILRRRLEGKMAFSVCTGNGRTLKGRDLSQVRNSILRMTGFLEA